ncbi:GntR family transcriptional regulator [soil metagenome]
MDSATSRKGRRVFREDVKDFLLDAILSGELKPGDRIVETHIAQRIGVSQGPVREALRDLELFGFVESEPFRGTRVRQTTIDDLVEVYPVRAALEGVAAREAAKRITPTTLSELERLLQLMRDAANADDRKSHIEFDVQFHKTVVESSGNRMLFNMWQSARLSGSTTVTVALAHRSLMELADRHNPIIDALRNGDPDAAETAMRGHIEELGRWIVEETRRSELSIDELQSSLSTGDGQ